jgi:hypothetical protein
MYESRGTGRLMETGSGSIVIGVIRRFWQFQLH